MKDRKYLHNKYNATSTENSEGTDIETYEYWLERQLLSRIETIELLETKIKNIEKEIGGSDADSQHESLHIVKGCHASGDVNVSEASVNGSLKEITNNENRCVHDMSDMKIGDEFRFCSLCKTHYGLVAPVEGL